MYISPAFAIIVQLSVFLIPYIAASSGDRSIYYLRCLRTCQVDNCTIISDQSEDILVFKKESAANQHLGARLLKWSCLDECKYDCMWKTVAWFDVQHFSMPKFHGKWPFYRFFGIQEPASALFSIMNLIAHIQMLHKLNKRLMEPDIPFKLCWRIFSVVCIHAWTWSTIFHTRDTPFTEFMDYTCALSMVMAFYAAAVVRVLYGIWHPYSALLVLSPGFLYYVEHTRYLWSGVVDYGLNMTLNIGLGMIGGLLWLLFALWQYCKDRTEGVYVWRIVVFTLLSAASLLLEVFDFPPLMGVVDAHALWHLSTSPLTYLFYEFLTDDIDYIVAARKKSRDNIKLE